MAKVKGQIVIARPIEEVFDFVADERNEPRYNPNMRLSEKISQGPIGVGTRFRAEILSRGRPAEMLIEFTTYDRPRQLASITTMSTMEIRGSLSFEPVPEGTRMHWSWTLKPRGLLRLMAPIVSRLGRRQEEAIWTGLKRVLEERNARSYA